MDAKTREYIAYLTENGMYHPDYQSRERSVDRLRNLSYSDDFTTRLSAKEAMHKLGLNVNFQSGRDSDNVRDHSDIKSDKYIVVMFENSLFRG